MQTWESPTTVTAAEAVSVWEIANERKVGWWRTHPQTSLTNELVVICGTRARKLARCVLLVLLSRFLIKKKRIPWNSLNIHYLPMNQSVLNCSSIDMYKAVNVFRNLNRNAAERVSHTTIVPLNAKSIIWYIQDRVGRAISCTCGKKSQLFQAPGKLYAPT